MTSFLSHDVTKLRHRSLGRFPTLINFLKYSLATTTTAIPSNPKPLSYAFRSRRPISLSGNGVDPNPKRNEFNPIHPISNPVSISDFKPIIFLTAGRAPNHHRRWTTPWRRAAKNKHRQRLRYRTAAPTMPSRSVSVRPMIAISSSLAGKNCCNTMRCYNFCFFQSIVGEIYVMRALSIRIVNARSFMRHSNTNYYSMDMGKIEGLARFNIVYDIWRKYLYLIPEE